MDAAIFGVRLRRDCHTNPAYVQLDEMCDSEKPFTRWLVTLSLADCLVCSCLMSMSFYTGYVDNGVTLLCICLQAFAHLMSSVLLIQRFCVPSVGDKNITLRVRRKNMVTEQKFGMMIGVVLLLSCIALLVKAARKFRFWDQWHADHTAEDTNVEIMTEVLAWTAGGWFLLQFCARYWIQRKIRFNLLAHAWPVSAVGFLFCLCMALAASYEKEGTWKADAVCASVLALVTGLEGFRTIYHYFDDVDEVLTREKRP